MTHTAVVGGGVSGLATALTLARQGHRVTIVERDDTPMPDSVDGAFEWDRRGAPQVRHSHALLGRLRNLLRDRHPDVLQTLLDLGATEVDFAARKPETLDDPSPADGDDDLVMLAARRTTFEFALRSAVLHEPGVELVVGRGVDGLLADDQGRRPPHVTGLRFDDGSTLDADVVVAANGRRSTAPEWLRAIGADIGDDQVEDTGIVYWSRFYRLADGADFPAGDRLIGGDLTYLKYGVFWGDNDTFSVTFATGDDDRTFRAIKDPALFDQVTSLIPATAPWLTNATPITGVHSMAGLLNRRRRFVVDALPVATGFFAVGDAHVCTNPLYGRGCSTGVWQADLLGAALRDHDNAIDQATAFDAAVRAEVIPWYKASVNSDRRNRVASARAARIAAGEPADDDPDALRHSIFRDGLQPATRTDAVVWRAFMRMMNLLDPPSAIEHPDVMARVVAVWEQRHERAPEPPLGPDRDEMLDALGLNEAA